MRGKIVDVSKDGNFAPSSRYFIDYKPTQNVTIDGSTEDWRDASFIGLSQDKYNFLTSGGSPIQGRPADPDDFSGHIAVKMDDTNLYFAARISDSGTPMIDTPATPNLGFNFDHTSLYLGLYDISALPGSPHVEKNFNFVNADTVVTESAGSGYRIMPGTDDTETTIGPDYQIIVRALDYGGDGAVVSGANVSEYNGARVDSTITTTTASSSLFDDEDGYVIEWMVPLASLSGDIASNTSRQAFAFYYDWPLFAPAVGTTIAFDADITDKDEGDQGTEPLPACRQRWCTVQHACQLLTPRADHRRLVRHVDGHRRGDVAAGYGRRRAAACELSEPDERPGRDSVRNADGWNGTLGRVQPARSGSSCPRRRLAGAGR